MQRESHADSQHVTDRKCHRGFVRCRCVRCRLPYLHGHIDSHSSSGCHEGKDETEATQDGCTGNGCACTDDGCADQIKGTGTAAAADNCARCRAPGLPPADQRRKLL